MTKETASELVKVGDLDVVARQPATYRDGPYAGRTTRFVHELLLSDGSTVYHCRKTPDCVYTNTAITSITAHMPAHGRRLKRALNEAEEKAAQLQQELEARRARKAEGGRKAAETRRANRANVPVELGGRGGAGANGTSAKSAVGDPEIALAGQRVIIAWNALQEASDAFQNVFLGYMRMVQVASEKVQQPAPIDPEILEKAKKYDALKGMLA